MEYDNSHPGEAYLQWFHSYPISSPKRISWTPGKHCALCIPLAHENSGKQMNSLYYHNGRKIIYMLKLFSAIWLSNYSSIPLLVDLYLLLVCPKASWNIWPHVGADKDWPKSHNLWPSQYIYLKETIYPLVFYLNIYRTSIILFLLLNIYITYSLDKSSTYFSVLLFFASSNAKIYRQTSFYEPNVRYL
jgi:hypothetical protein